MHSRAKELVQYLSNEKGIIHASLISQEYNKESNASMVKFSVEVDLPQRPVRDIKSTEIIRVTFVGEDDAREPLCHVDRTDFPLTPHQNQKSADDLPWLCLSERPWAEDRGNWGAGKYVERIRRWLSDAASGMLHRADQPLEPILRNYGYVVTMPEIERRGANSCWLEKYYFRTNKPDKTTFLIGERSESLKSKAFPVYILELEPQTQSILKVAPRNLLELANLTKSPTATLGMFVQAIKDTHSYYKSAKEAESTLLLFCLLMPKQRVENGRVEGVERWIFIFEDSLRVVFEKLGILQKDPSSNYFVPIFCDIKVSPQTIESLKVEPVKVYDAASRADAAAANGLELKSNPKVLCIGAGALGSQLAGNLVRTGFGKWRFLDMDILLPHNTYRHFLGSESVGLSKASVMQEMANAMFCGESKEQPLLADILAPGNSKVDIEKALLDADIILDCSASVGVMRYLGKVVKDGKKCASIFISPSGYDLVFIGTTNSSKEKLEYLESLYFMRSLEKDMNGHFERAGNGIHYGNSCRDVSTILPQSVVAIHSGIATKLLIDFYKGSSSMLCVYRTNPETLESSRIDIKVDPSVSVELFDWTVTLTKGLCVALCERRKDALPRETGGILIGVYDSCSKNIELMFASRAPRDSIEYPTSFIRGTDGLLELVQSMESRTLGVVTYLGEWHSHPEGCTSHPSSVDDAAIKLFSPYLQADGKPALMVIVGEGDKLTVIMMDVISGKRKMKTVKVSDV